jgi:hypothetical protein
MKGISGGSCVTPATNGAARVGQGELTLNESEMDEYESMPISPIWCSWAWVVVVALPETECTLYSDILSFDCHLFPFKMSAKYIYETELCNGSGLCLTIRWTI